MKTKAKSDDWLWKVETVATMILLGVTIGGGAGHYATEWWHTYKHTERIEQHRARCFEDTKYIRYIGFDSRNEPLCFQQSKKTWKIERTTLVYPD